MGCDVFISYRRIDGAYPTLLLYRDLIDAGYNTFYDVANIRNGKFPELIEQNVKSCIDFLLMVTPSTFSDKILNEDDWVRKEIRLALENNKNIVPIFIGNVNIPNFLPEDIRAIAEYNGILQIDPQTFYDTNKKIFTDYLQTPQNSKDPVQKARLRCSVYDATYGDEFERLKTQSINSYSSDMDVLNKHLAKDKTYVVLDVGCAYGFVGKSRFDAPCFSKVLGIDSNSKCITKAKELTNNPRFDYSVIDVELDDFEEKLQEEMDKHGINSFDVVYAALVIHHLKDPNRFLRRIKKFLSNDGILIIRGSDDGSKMAYNDNGLMKQIIELTLKAPNVSDRYNGRKIFSLLKKAGYEHISMYSYMRDISSSNYEEREQLFNESFSYRVNYVRREFESSPNDIEKKKDLYKMEELLAKFQERFYDSTFWYCEYDYIGIAKRGN